MRMTRSRWLMTALVVIDLLVFGVLGAAAGDADAALNPPAAIAAAVGILATWAGLR